MSSAPNGLAPEAGARDAGASLDSVKRRVRLLPTLAAIVVVTVCVAAGTWQWQRMHAKEALRAEFDAAARADPVSFASLPAETDWAALRFRQVVATGEYLASRQILIDNRVYAGRAGYHVVTPMVLSDGRWVLVNRGWIAQGASRSMLPAAVPPAGVVSVRGRIAWPSARYLELRSEPAPGTVWQNLDPGRFASATGLAVIPAVIEATAAPAPDDALIRDWPAPDFGIETHWIYMMQWYAFALVAVVLWIVFNRPRSSRARDG